MWSNNYGARKASYRFTMALESISCESRLATLSHLGSMRSFQFNFREHTMVKTKTEGATKLQSQPTTGYIKKLI